MISFLANVPGLLSGSFSGALVGVLSLALVSASVYIKDLRNDRNSWRLQTADVQSTLTEAQAQHTQQRAIFQTKLNEAHAMVEGCLGAAGTPGDLACELRGTCAATRGDNDTGPSLPAPTGLPPGR